MATPQSRSHTPALLPSLLSSAAVSACQVLKLYAWEASFEQQVLDIRSQEIGVLKRTAYLNAFFQFIWSSAPFAVSPWSGAGAGVCRTRTVS